MEIYLPEDQRSAITSIDTSKLREFINEAVQERRLSNLQNLRLRSCGTYIAQQYHNFEQALLRYREAKSSRKQTEAGDYLRRTESNLIFAVESMKRRVEEERQDEERFYLRGEFAPPYRFSQQLSAKVSYRWRKTVDDEWTHGSVTFIHDVNLIPDHNRSRSLRKLTASKHQQALQQELSNTWENLMLRALYSVRDYFREGGEAHKIPETFRAHVGASGFLDNYSTIFWQTRNDD